MAHLATLAGRGIDPLQARQTRAALRMHLTRSASPADLEPFEEAISAGKTIRPSPYEIDALVRGGQPDLARAVLEQWPKERHATAALRYGIGRAIVAAAIDEPEIAVRVLRETIDLSRRLVARNWEARLLVYLGRCEIGMGERAQARSNLNRSRELWERMGAGVCVIEVDELLTSIGP